MSIEIYGIQESDYRCGGCIEAKRIFDYLNLDYNFKRILTKDENGSPIYDQNFLAELRSKIHFTTLMLPYIFIDNKMIKIGKLKQYLQDSGYDLSDLD